MRDTELYRAGDPFRRMFVDGEGMRTQLAVPLYSGDTPMGGFTLSRQRVEAFSDAEIALVETFAAQAIIAIENARQFRELQTKLEHEAATRELLSVISQSRDDEEPVFQMIVQSAARLCASHRTTLTLVDEARENIVIRTAWGEEVLDRFIGMSLPLTDSGVAPTAIRERRLVHEVNIGDSDLYRQGHKHRRTMVDELGVHTLLSVPIYAGGEAIGCINLQRTDPGPFTDSQIALVESFAAQAVIAIENVRQFRELQTRLEREAATREILAVISQSQDDEQPVFDVILERSAVLCKVPTALLVLVNDDRTAFSLAALWGEWAHPIDLGTSWPIDADLPVADAIRGSRTVHLADIAKTQAYQDGEATYTYLVDEEGIHSRICVPLIRNGIALGAIVVSRHEVGAFDDSEVLLLETFAAQAVIAIENVRQFRELQTRLEREAATSGILEVISQSRDDDQPVFDVILEHAARLCATSYASLHLVDERRENWILTAARSNHHRSFEIGEVFPLPASRTAAATSILEARVVHIEDLADDDLYRQGDPVRVRTVDEEGARTMLVVPLITGGLAIGCITLRRNEVRPFSADQIALVESFAAQAVIAIENVRQFRELQTRLEREEANRAILQVISGSRGDELPVFNTILENSSRLCRVDMCHLTMVRADPDSMTLAAYLGKKLNVFEVGVTTVSLDSQQNICVAVRENRTIHTEDMQDSELYRSGDSMRRMIVDDEGMHTQLVIPLYSGDTPIGAFSLYRQRVERFAEREITLLETFAAQAVIAIENVRQFRELQTRLEREAATREILSVISQSRDEEQPVFDVILENAARLCGAPMARLLLANEERTHYRIAASWGDAHRVAQVGDVTEFNPVVVTARSILGNQVIQMPDMRETEGYKAGLPIAKRIVDGEGVRTLLLVPLSLGDMALSCITLNRREVMPFSDDEITLVQSFAAQAVIAIENVRQFRELQTRLEREAATREILSVISQSRDDEQPVFDVILKSASRLCNAPLAFLSMANEERTHVNIRAMLGARAEFTSLVENFHEPIEGAKLVAIRPIAEAMPIRVDDITADDLYRTGERWRMVLADIEGVRSLLAVPLVSGGKGIGAIVLYRREVAPFTDDDLALVQGFAAQAVIAVQNVHQFRELQTRLEREAATSGILEVISQSRDDDQPVFDVILENASRLCATPYASLVLLDEHRENWKLTAIRSNLNRSFKLGEGSALHGNSTAVAVSIREARVVQIEDLADDDLYRQGDSIRVRVVDEEGARTLLVVPLISGGLAIGCISLRRNEVQPFSSDQIALVESFAAQAVIAIENVRQFREIGERNTQIEALNTSLETRVEEQVGEIERMGRLKRFLSPQVANAVISSGDEGILSSHRALIGILFCDIRGFTAFCETAEPEETIEFLQTYHEEMGKLINAHGAGVDHRWGDGIMVIFNDPFPCEDPAGDALRLALAMREKMEEICLRWKRLGHRLGFGVGISLGYATVGMVGSEGRFDYTANGTAVNMAARLCDHAEDGEILLSPRAYTAVEDDFAAETLGEMTFKGIRQPVEVFRVMDASAQTSPP